MATDGFPRNCHCFLVRKISIKSSIASVLALRMLNGLIKNLPLAGRFPAQRFQRDPEGGIRVFERLLKTPNVACAQE